MNSSLFVVDALKVPKGLSLQKKNGVRMWSIYKISLSIRKTISTVIFTECDDKSGDGSHHSNADYFGVQNGVGLGPLKLTDSSSLESFSR